MALLKLVNLSKTYKTGDKALKNINLKVNEGEFISVIGSSGAGKSTMIRCINRLIEPNKDSHIYLEDTDIKYESWGYEEKSLKKLEILSNIVEKDVNKVSDREIDDKDMDNLFRYIIIVFNQISKEKVNYK